MLLFEVGAYAEDMGHACFVSRKSWSLSEQGTIAGAPVAPQCPSNQLNDDRDVEVTVGDNE